MFLININWTSIAFNLFFKLSKFCSYILYWLANNVCQTKYREHFHHPHYLHMHPHNWAASWFNQLIGILSNIHLTVINLDLLLCFIFKVKKLRPPPPFPHSFFLSFFLLSSCTSHAHLTLTCKLTSQNVKYAFLKVPKVLWPWISCPKNLLENEKKNRFFGITLQILNVIHFRINYNLNNHTCDYSSSIITWASSTVSPSLKLIAFTVPELLIERPFCIFIASIIHSSWPSVT